MSLIDFFSRLGVQNDACTSLCSPYECGCTETFLDKINEAELEVSGLTSPWSSLNGTHIISFPGVITSVTLNCVCRATGSQPAEGISAAIGSSVFGVAIKCTGCIYANLVAGGFVKVECQIATPEAMVELLSGGQILLNPPCYSEVGTISTVMKLRLTDISP